MKTRTIVSKKLLILLPLMVISFYFTASKAKVETGEELSSGTPITVAEIQSSSLTQYLDLNGTTTFIKKEVVRTTVQGFVTKTLKNIGDAINGGDILFLIKTREAEATEKFADSTASGKFSGIIQIRAKSKGILTQLNHNTGDFVTDAEQLAVVSNPSSIEVLLNVPYQNASQIRLNSACTLVLPDAKKIPATVSKIIPSVDATSQTQTFLIHAEGISTLPENLNLTIRIPVKTVSNALVVPKGALLCDETQENFWIMSLLNDSLAVKTIVTRGIENDSIVQILAPGLTSGQKIIHDGAYGLPDTAKVVIRK